MVQDEEHKEEEEEDDFQTDEDEEMEVDEQVTSKRKKASFLNMYLKWCVCVCVLYKSHSLLLLLSSPILRCRTEVFRRNSGIITGNLDARKLRNYKMGSENEPNQFIKKLFSGSFPEEHFYEIETLL